MSFAVATITVFGVLATFLYPLIGAVLGLSELSYGIWAGTAVHETAQVIAAGFMYGEQAGEIATVVKLVRKWAFLAPRGVGAGPDLYPQGKKALPQQERQCYQLEKGFSVVYTGLYRHGVG